MHVYTSIYTHYLSLHCQHQMTRRTLYSGNSSRNTTLTPPTTSPTHSTLLNPKRKYIYLRAVPSTAPSPPWSSRRPAVGRGCPCRPKRLSAGGCGGDAPTRSTLYIFFPETLARIESLRAEFEARSGGYPCAIAAMDGSEILVGDRMAV